MAKSYGMDSDFSAADSNDANIKYWFDTFMKPALSTTKVCYDTAGCWNDGDTKNMNGSNVYYNRKGVGVGSNIITAVLNDGTFVNFDIYGKGSIKNYFGVDIDESNGLIIYFDINGGRKPNTLGKDIFAVVYKNETIVPAYSDATEEQIKQSCSKNGTGHSCIFKYLEQ